MDPEALIQALTQAIAQLSAGGGGGSGPSISIPPFWGKQSEVARYWLAKVELILLAKNVADPRKVFTAATAFHGPAEGWFNSAAPELLQQERTAGFDFIRWNTFKSAVLGQYPIPNEQTILREAIGQLKQWSSVQDYQQEFQVLRSLCENYSDLDAKVAFISGLK
eukprot:CAMPEP_0198351426 /NCGR_PEP_ID=MMETSP1450-20131203/102796_1 /TAXON_ID=753684 ORGANISM="Madagascaria erythrocladiodes, Strain CCMP3234" /NCGR_SAMPLE_ID=MMETSP1450 /ASSEMBLY_ACC=CAM_ASM_001115 /LENGTH=164 /DNA_ID=CAMNT_0044057347 /DNA_START=64 /DNA_END=555 /DNA_ORIENTATION=+